MLEQGPCAVCCDCAGDALGFAVWLVGQIAAFAIQALHLSHGEILLGGAAMLAVAAADSSNILSAKLHSPGWCNDVSLPSWLLWYCRHTACGACLYDAKLAANNQPCLQQCASGTACSEGDAALSEATAQADCNQKGDICWFEQTDMEFHWQWLQTQTRVLRWWFSSTVEYSCPSLARNSTACCSCKTAET